MKRLFAASVLAAGLLASADCARASSFTTTGGAQLQWKSGATLSMAIVTQYSAAFAQGSAIPPLLPSAAGVCTPAGTEANFTMTFGALVPSKTVPTACLYKNALAVSVQSNDAAGFVVNEYLDSTPTAGIGICAYPNGVASFPITAVAGPVPTSARAGNPAAGTFTGMALTSCAAGGTIVPPGTGGASSAGTNPGNVGAAGLEFYSPSGAGIAFVSKAGPTVSGAAIVAMYGAEDIQVNLAPNALSSPAGNTGIYLTIQLVPN
ncbi:MAG TPA: hypothetical protein VGC72_09570 [Candidatus Elarobacter sp.]